MANFYSRASNYSVTVGQVQNQVASIFLQISLQNSHVGRTPFCLALRPWAVKTACLQKSTTTFLHLFFLCTTIRIRILCLWLLTTHYQSSICQAEGSKSFWSSQRQVQQSFIGHHGWLWHSSLTRPSSHEEALVSNPVGQIKTANALPAELEKQRSLEFYSKHVSPLCWQQSSSASREPPWNSGAPAKDVERRRSFTSASSSHEPELRKEGTPSQLNCFGRELLFFLDKVLEKCPSTRARLRFQSNLIRNFAFEAAIEKVKNLEECTLTAVVRGVKY